MSSTTYSPKQIGARPQAAFHAHRKAYFLIALAVLLTDQFTKWLIVVNLLLHDSFRVIPDFFQITHVENQGAAFGLFSDSPSIWKADALILFSMLALVVVSVLLWKNSHRFTWGGFGLALILGGALGNLWDRVFQGHVVDFLDFYLGNAHWPAFNIADSAIVVGAFLLVGEILFAKTEADPQSNAR